MNPFTLSKIGNVTIQRIPPKQEDSDNRNEEPSAVPAEEPPKPVQSILFPKLPPSINITLKSTNITSEPTESHSQHTNTEAEKLLRENYNSDYSDESEPTKLNESETVSVDKDVSDSSGTEPCDKPADKLEEEFSESLEKSPDVKLEADKNELDSENAVEFVPKMDLEDIAEGEVSEPADVLEELPNISDELVDSEEFREEPNMNDELGNNVECGEEPNMNDELGDNEESREEPNMNDELGDNEEFREEPNINDELVDDEFREESNINDELVDNEEFREEPSISDELVDNEEFREEDTDTQCNDDIPDVPVDELIEGELPEEMLCKEEKFSDKDESESDDADDELDEKQTDSDTVTKKKRKTKSEGDSKDSKKQKTASSPSSDEKNSDSEEKEKTAGEMKVGNLRRNIREVMDETKLDEATLAAQMQEKERLRRVQEQLRANRDIQRQMMQARALSMIGRGGTPTIKQEEEYEDDYMEEQKPNNVVVLTTGSSEILDILKKQNSSSASEDEDASLDKFANLSKNLSKPQMMTASVSIAPVTREQKKPVGDVEKSEMIESGKTKGKDVVMISDSSSEEDDCIVISEEESEPEEDVANSGMHTNDLYNVPDDQGRVLINVGHPDSEKDVFLAPQIARIIKPHQIGGVRFLFDNIVESLDRYKMSEGFGCILAHSMGLGKTLQVISFCDVFLRYTEGKTVLCIMPINTLQNWVAEFNMWLPTEPENSPLKEQGEVLPRQFPLFVLNDNQKTLSARANVITQWYKEGGVLLIGYELYRQLSLKKPPKSRTRSKKKIEQEEDYADEKSKTLLETIYNALVKPGPDLVICDEGHRIKNSHASISQALKQIRSKRRVVLTGYPLQNNLLEYWCMVDFVRPNYLGTKTEFSNMFERPIQNGQCIDSTPQDVKLMRYRSHVLHSLLEGFVQRRSHSVLQQTLPSKYEFVLLLRLTSFQRELYNTFMNEVVRTKAVPNPLKAFAVCCKIWNHPDILYNFLKKRAGEEDIDLDLEETAPSMGTPVSGPNTPMTASTPPHQSASKRSRNRTTKGSQSKEAKLARKNARTNTPQPINKPPSIAAVPPNTANNPKPLPPEEAITTTNNQPIPPFNMYNNNQFSNFNQSGGDDANLSYPNQTANSGQNFNNQFGNQEYNVPPVTNNTEYGNVNYQQNFNEGNYYQSDYPQNNYWQQGNNEGGNNFYNSSTSSTDDYYQPSSQSSSSYSTNEYNAQSESSFAPGNYNNQNYAFDMNQPMSYSSNTADFPTKSQEVDNLQHFNMNEATGMLGSNMLSDINSTENVFSDDLNYQHSTNDTMDLGHMTSDIKPNLSQFNPAGRGSFHNAGRLPNSGPGMTPFNSATPPFAAQPPRGKRPGRPPLSQSRARTAGTPRPSGAGRSKRGAGARNVASAAADAAKFKPGLPGGAPMKADDQHFPTANAQNTHMLAGGTDLSVSGGAAYSNQMNPTFLENIRNEELWNPGTGEPSGFVDPGFMYNEAQPPSQPIMPNDAPSLLGGVRASRNLLNEIQSNEIFNPTQPATGFSQNPSEQNLYLDSFNYLSDLQMSGHTSFMGLLEGDDSLDMHHNDVGAGGVPINVQPNLGNQPDSFIDPSGLPFQATDAVDKHTFPKTSAGQLEQVTRPPPAAAVEKDVSQSIQGLARRGQITLKVVDNKKAEATTANLEKPNVLAASPSHTQAAGGDAGFPPFSKGQQQPQARLPSIDVFNTNPSFAANATRSLDGGNVSNRSYGYGEESRGIAGAPASQSNSQANWDTYGAENQQNFNYASAAGNQMNKTQARPTMKKESPGTEPSRVQPAAYQGELKANDQNYAQPTAGYGSAKTAIQEASTKDNLLSRFGANQNVSLISVNEPKKPNSETRDFYPPATAGKVDVVRAGGGQPTSKTIPKTPKMEKRPQPVRRNPMMGMAKSNYPQAKSENPEEAQQLQPTNMPRESTAFASLAKSMDMCRADALAKEAAKDDSDAEARMPAPEMPATKGGKDTEPGIPYEWTNEFFKDYEPGKIEASAKTVVFFCMLDEIIRLGDRLLLFSQSLFTLDLIEDFLHLMDIPNTEEKWARNKSYFRLDGSTSALEREKLINEFNSNPNVHLFLVSTRAGSLGINLVGANRVVVFDASWNPCHDTQAVCRVYRYGQQKSCYVYRFVTDHCLEKKIYDRQINKQGMSDRIVDECNPDAHLTIKDVSNLCWDNEDVSEAKKDLSPYVERYNDVVIQKVIREHGAFLSKEPFQHESLLVDRKDNKLSQAEKRMAKRGYELEKQATLKPSYGLYNNPHVMQSRLGKPMASVRPMVADHPREPPVRRWIPAEVWQKQGMSAQEMTLPLDVVIPTSTTDTRSSVVLKAGQKVMVLKSHKGIYMQLENGKIIAIKTALKTGIDGPGNGKPMGMAPRNSSMGLGPGVDGMGRMNRMPRPPVDRTLAALSSRRDVTVSPIRNRGHMRPNMGGPNMHSHAGPGLAPPLPHGMLRQPHPSSAAAGRPSQPIMRSFPLSRPQPGRPSNPNHHPPLHVQRPAPQLPPSATSSASGGSGKQFFGPNSAVTISVANKKRMESQQRMANAQARFLQSSERL